MESSKNYRGTMLSPPVAHPTHDPRESSGLLSNTGTGCQEHIPSFGTEIITQESG